MLQRVSPCALFRNASDPMDDNEQEIEIDMVALVEDTLKGVFISVEGRVPSAEEGGFRPNRETVAQLEAEFEGNVSKMRSYCTDVMLAYLWSKRQSPNSNKFFVNKKLLSEKTRAYVKKYRDVLRREYGEILKGSDLFEKQVYADVLSSESDYLQIASQCYIHDEDMDWKIIMPSVHWTLFCSGDLSEMPEGRFARMSVPLCWWRFPLNVDGSRVLFKEQYRMLRQRLKPVAIRRVYLRAARRAMWDAARYWAECAGILRTHVDEFGTPIFMPEGSMLDPNLLDVTSPLLRRDKQLFAVAKQWRKEHGGIKPLPPLKYYEDREEEDEDSLESLGSLGSRGVTVKKGSLAASKAKALQETVFAMDE